MTQKGLSDDEISLVELAKICDIPDRAVSQFTRDGIFFRAGRGTYYRDRSLAGYIEHLKGTIHSLQSGQKGTRGQKDKFAALKEEQEYIRRKRENDADARKLIEVDQIRPLWTRLLKSIRGLVEEQVDLMIAAVPEMSAQRVESMQRMRDELFQRIDADGKNFQGQGESQAEESASKDD